jgi:hypothetical protein
MCCAVAVRATHLFPMSNCATCNTATFFFLLLIATHFATRIYLSFAKETPQKLAGCLVVLKVLDKLVWTAQCPAKQAGYQCWVVVQASRLKIKLVHCYTQRNNAMTALTGLKLTASTEAHADESPIQQRRNKLAKRLWEQAELARAQQAGTTFAPTTLPLCRYRCEHWTNASKLKRSQTQSRQWWFVADNGKLVLSVRYGTKVAWSWQRASGQWKWVVKRIWCPRWNC